MGGFNLQDLMSKAKAQYDTLQKKMQETVVEASSGGGTVTAKMDGRKQLLSLRIDPEAVKSGDVEMLQDLVLAAVNEAARKIDTMMQSTLVVSLYCYHSEQSEGALHFPAASRLHGLHSAHNDH